MIPLLGPLHLRYPAYNAVVVRDLARAARPDALALAPLAPGALEEPAWQDTPEIALPLAVVPWARRAGLPLHPVGEPSPDPTASADARRYLAAYGAARASLAELDAVLAPLEELLAQPLTPERVRDELLPLLRRHHELRLERLEDGPLTDWSAQRGERVAERVLALPAERLVLLAEAEQVPALEAALEGRAELEPPPPVPPGDEARRRATLDWAFLGDAPDPAGLLARLRELDGAEARYHEASLLLAHGHAAEALERLEAASRGDFAEPYFLPGYLLARLGQLYDLDGRRDAALRAYRGALALDWAPAEARATARDGLERPFRLEASGAAAAAAPEAAGEPGREGGEDPGREGGES